MISSREDAPRYADAALITDGTDETLMRSAEFEIRPTSKQAGALTALLRVLCTIYNAALEERRDAWRYDVRWRARRASEKKLAAQSGKPLPVVPPPPPSVLSQFDQLPLIQTERPELGMFGTQPLRGVLRRLDTAYSSFVKRASSGQKPGAPRFRSFRRFDTASWAEPVSWKLHLASSALYVQGVGHITLPPASLRQLQRLLERGGEPRTLTITRRCTRKGLQWRAVVGFRAVDVAHQPPSQGQGSVGGWDRGVAVTIAGSEGEFLTMPEWPELREEIKVLQRKQSRCERGSKQYVALGHRIRRRRRRLADRVENWARQTAREIVATTDVVVLEELKLQNMMKSASGTEGKPGKNVAQKRGLNRSLQDAALGQLGRWVAVKAEEAGRRTWLVPAAYSSQECSQCGYTASGNRLERDTFACLECGFTAHADTQAALVVAKRGRDAEEAWVLAGSSLLKRPRPRMLRRKSDGGDASPPS